MCAHVEAERRDEATCTRVRTKEEERGRGGGEAEDASDRGEANRGVDRLNDSDNDERGRVITMEEWPWDNEGR